MKRSRRSIGPFNRHDLSQASYSRVAVGLQMQTSIKRPSIINAGERRMIHIHDGDQMLTETHLDDSIEIQCKAITSLPGSSVLPPPPPEPVYSVHMRVLPTSLTAMSSPKGRRYLLESLSDPGTAPDCFWRLIEQFLNQSEPAYCGVTTLVMVGDLCNHKFLCSMHRLAYRYHFEATGFECNVS